MEHYEREFFIARIDAGYIKYRCNNDTVLHLCSPSQDVLYDAQEIYSDTMRKASYEGVLGFEDTLAILMDAEVWTSQMEEEFNILPKNIEKLKVELYNAVYKSELRKQIRKYLAVSKQEFDRLNDIRHSWDYITCEGIASFARWQHIVHNSVVYPDGTPYKWNISPLADVMSFYQAQTLTEEVVRELARSEPWISLWTVRKKNGAVFPAPLTLEQRALMVWSNMYDNIFESPECPHDTVISDDDMLDGWIVVQREKREKDQAKKRGEDLVTNPKIAAAQELFVPADTAEDAKMITDMNETYGDMVRRSRLKKVKQESEVNFGAFGDVKRRLQTEAAAKFAEKVKKG